MCTILYRVGKYNQKSPKIIFSGTKTHFNSRFYLSFKMKYTFTSTFIAIFVSELKLLSR